MAASRTIAIQCRSHLAVGIPYHWRTIHGRATLLLRLSSVWTPVRIRRRPFPGQDPGSSAFHNVNRMTNGPTRNTKKAEVSRRMGRSVSFRFTQWQAVVMSRREFVPRPRISTKRPRHPSLGDGGWPVWQNPSLLSTLHIRHANFLQSFQSNFLFFIYRLNGAGAYLRTSYRCV